MDCSSLASSVHEILQAKTTGVGYHAFLPGIFPDPGIKPVSLVSPALPGRFFTSSATGKALFKRKGPNSSAGQGWPAT